MNGVVVAGRWLCAGGRRRSYSIYGSSDAQARAYRDAIITALPPPTNLEQAVKIRRNNKSGISGVRRVETEEGDVWQATLMTNEGQKRESFSIGRLGEEAAKSMAITQRMRWLKALPVRHLAYAHHAEEITRQNFDHQLDTVADVAPQVQTSEEEVVARSLLKCRYTNLLAGFLCMDTLFL